jgi:hypothetical protein
LEGFAEAPWSTGQSSASAEKDRGMEEVTRPLSRPGCEDIVGWLAGRVGISEEGADQMREEIF